MRMRIVIAGGHGQVALRLERLLSARGDEVAGIIRKPEQGDDLLAAGAEPSSAIWSRRRSPTSPGTWRARTRRCSRQGRGRAAGKPARTRSTARPAPCSQTRPRRPGCGGSSSCWHPAWNREPPAGTDPVFAAYLRAKGAADADVQGRAGLDWTILRPGRLTDGPGAWTAALNASTGRGAVPRDDVAAVIAALLDEPRTAGQTLELISGAVQVADAVTNAAR